MRLVRFRPPHEDSGDWPLSPGLHVVWEPGRDRLNALRGALRNGAGAIGVSNVDGEERELSSLIAQWGIGALPCVRPLPDAEDAEARRSHIQRELLAFTDAGAADEALARLETRLKSIGRKTEPGALLPSLRAQRAALQRELEQAKALAPERRLRRRRREQIEKELTALRDRRNAFAQELETQHKAHRAARLKQAEEIAQALEEATQRCFAASAGRDFPAEKVPALEELERRVNTAREEADKRAKELEAAQAKLTKELERLGPPDEAPMQTIGREWDSRLEALEAETLRCREMAETLEKTCAATEEALRQAQKDLAALPDFSHVAPDPAEWLTSHVNNYIVARRVRDEARTKRADLQRQIGEARAELALPERVFSGSEELIQELHEFEAAAKLAETQQDQLRRRLEQLRLDIEDCRDEIPGYRVMSGVFVFLFACFTAAALTTGMPAVYIPVSICGVGLVFYPSRWWYSHASIRKAETHIEQSLKALDRVREEHDAREREITAKIQRAGCSNVREMEAMYERYQDALKRLAELERQLAKHEPAAAQEEDRVAQLFRELVDRFHQAGQELLDDQHFDEAIAQTAARFQEYRDAKRRVYEGRERLAQQQSELEKTRAQLDAALREDLNQSLAIREMLRRNGYREESRHTSALSALKAYRVRHAQVKHRRTRAGTLRQTVAELEEKAQGAVRAVSEQQAAFEAALKELGVRSLEEARERAQAAKDYAVAWRERQRLHERLEDALDGEDIESLRERVRADGPPPARIPRNIEDLERQLAENGGAIENGEAELRAIDEALGGELAPGRPANSIEEELALVNRRCAALETERDAASYAAATLAEAARETRRRIARGVQTHGRAMLEKLLGGAAFAWRMGDDLALDATPSPQEAAALNLAVWIALARALDGEEPLPLLVDGALDGWDADALTRAAEALADAAKEQQIIVFTSAPEVAQALRGKAGAVTECAAITEDA